MDGSTGSGEDLTGLRVLPVGALRATGSLFDPFQLVDPGGEPVGAVAAFLRELQGRGLSEGTQRSYGMDLLRWFRFLWAVEVSWEQATRAEARDFMRWLRIAHKPERAHWRTGVAPGPGAAVPGAVNAVTGRPSPGRGFSVATAAHTETVARTFYDYHLQAGSGPLGNPFPLARPGRRAHAHRSPMEPSARERAGLYRPRQPERVPRQIPDRIFDELFARLGSDRDRALVAFWVSTGARAAELLGLRVADVDPGCQTVRVVRKGSRAIQPLPASPDAFVWLRLYQAGTAGLVPAGPDDPVWWTRRRPLRPLGYHAARAMFDRANTMLGANWTLHTLRHTAAYRMARDPLMPLTDVQWVLGHAHLTTTQIYVRPTAEDVIESVLAHHRRRAEVPPAPPPTAGYRPESLDALFGGRAW
ncbi:site-specific integrase [Frankia sp. Cr1]|uniref:tyrosine-type recombinase/integrase n=1 Tax=Frankia sp. Cr1 TaxID=3073931 RepID=UPI002AD2F156|nr:site-specific integrase [Frankia sp. Cr1]